MKDIEKLIARLRYAHDPKDDYASMGVAEVMAEAADALEAATRVPIQGEPNDDREAREREVDEMILRGRRMDTTVPDAATERVGYLEAELESRIDDRNYWHGYAAKMQGQLEVALDAIERVRAIHASELVNSYYGGTHSICIECERPYPCQTIVALDGAPEPEVKP